MRVGLFLPTRPPEQGGSFTFEDNFFRSLVEYAPESPHKFVLFGRQCDLRSRVFSEKFETVIIRNIAFLRAQSHLKLILNSFVQKFLLIPPLFGYEGWLDHSIIDHRIDVVLNLTPALYTTAVPYITVLWDLQHRLQPYFPEISAGGRWGRWEEKFSILLRRASYVITGTNVGKSEIEFLYQLASRRIKVLPLPTPGFALEAPPGDHQDVIKKFKLPEKFLFYPAQFWPHKNHANLLLAVKKLQEQKCDVSVVLVGKDHGNGAYIRQLTRELGLDNKVLFLGFVSREELVGLYKNALALVYLSLFGPDNTPPLEAFALGCPVIANNWQGANEQLGSSAFLVTGTNTDEIATAIKRFFDDPGLRDEYVKRGYVRARQFTGREYLKGVFSILDEFEPFRRCWGDDRPYQNPYSLKYLLSRLKIPF